MMKKLYQVLALSGVTAAFLLGANQAQAQPGGFGGGRDFDPAQMQERMLERYKEVLEFTNDVEWDAVKPLVQKVMDARRETFAGMGRGMFGRGPRGGGPGGEQGGEQRGGPPRNRGGFGQPSPATEALQQALDSNASADVIKAKLAALREERKEKEAALTKAQEDLRKVLNTRREAQAVLSGLLN
jgi:hypothetical protein